MEDSTIYYPMHQPDPRDPVELSEAVLDIDTVIQELTSAKNEGATHVAFGLISEEENNRYGADWLRPLAGEWAWVSED